MLSLRTQNSTTMDVFKIGVIREGKNPPDERVPLTPAQCRLILDTYPQVDLVVESSPVRRIRDEEYEKQGIRIVTDLSDRDVLLGVKEVPIPQLLAEKTYFFFSHTIKEQPYNRDLLLEILRKNITMVDYETLTAASGKRLIGFGRYAGIVGAYNGIRTWGLRHQSFELKQAFQCEDRVELEKELTKVKLPAIKIALTGRGRVAGGAIEILDALKIPKVSVADFLEKTFDHPVYAQLAVTDYNKRKDGQAFTKQNFFEHPDEYESNFSRFAAVTDLYVSGHYWDSESPFIFSRADARAPEFKIQVVADVSCDIDGPVASTLRPSTIPEPNYGYDPRTEKEVAFDAEGAISVMAVDNLPCELPRNASEDFGAEFIKHILPALLGDDPTAIIDRGTIAREGKLNAHFTYLQDYVNG